ncbi:MAG: amidohydrolase [Acidobacteriota bacterium]
MSASITVGAEHETTETATLLVVGGTVLTLDAEDTVLADGAVAMRGDTLVAVGPSAQLLERFPTAERLDATGKIVLPGLVNTHTHVPMTLFRGLADDLELMEWLQKHIFPAEARFVDEDFVRAGTRLACLEMIRGGTTTFVDMYYFEDALAEEVERCGLRAVLGQTLIDFPAPDFATWDEAMAGTRRFVERWRGHARIVPAVAPHAPYTVSSEHLVAAHGLAVELDVPLVMHLAEDRSELETIRARHGRGPVDYISGLGMLDRRLIAAHMVWPTDGEIRLLAERGVGVAHCPQSNMKLAAGVAPVPRLRAAGVAVGLGTDGPASNNDLDLWDEMDTAAKLHKLTTGDPTTLPATEVLRMATIEGARAIGMDHLIGSLEPGKRADLVIVSTDAFRQTPWQDAASLLVYSTRADDVDTVLVDGEILLRGGTLVAEGVDEILEVARDYRRRIVAADSERARDGSGAER